MNESLHGPGTAGASAAETDRILADLRPRLHAARVAHVRRVLAGVVVVPLLGVGGMAVSAQSNGPAPVETAATIDDTTSMAEQPAIVRPEPGSVAPEAAAATDDDDAFAVVTTAAPATSAAPTTSAVPTTTVPEDGTVLVEIGALGSLTVSTLLDDQGAIIGHELTETGLVDGWTVLNVDRIEDALVIVVGAEGEMKAVTIRAGLRDELLVSVDDFVVPTTTAAPAVPEPTPEPAPEPVPVIDRFVVEVGDRGSFVVERDGDTLFVGAVEAAEGHGYEIVKNQGWKVYVGFFTDDHVWYGKALINDGGDVEEHFWDQSLGPQPTYEWVDVPGFGSAKFEVLEGMVKVYKTETNDGVDAWDPNQGAHVEIARAEFEGNGQRWTVEAWVTESGELASTVTQHD